MIDGMDDESFDKQMAETARQLHESKDDVDSTFQTAVKLAQSSVDGCDAAGLTFVTDRQHVETVAATDDLAMAADRLQFELSEGPVLDAVWVDPVVRSRRLEHDARWPTWGPRVVEETGARCIMSFQLFTHTERLGALSLYSKSPDAFDNVAMADGFEIASHVSIAVSAALNVGNLHQALASRRVIGQATGVLMERYDLDEARAFTVLTRMSSQGNIKLRVLAAQIVENRVNSKHAVPGAAPVPAS